MAKEPIKVGSNDNRRDEYIDETIEVPDCFGFWDSEDPSCRRCKQKYLCADAADKQRAPCFGSALYGTSPSCSVCLDASMCSEQSSEKGSDKMANRKVKIRRHTPVKAVEPEEEEVEEEVEEEEVEEEVEEEEVEEEEDDNYVNWSIVDIRNELDGRGLDASGRKATLVARLLADDDSGDRDEVDEPVAKSKATPKAKAVAKPKAKVKVVEPEDEEDEPEDEEDDNDPVVGTIGELLESLDTGQMLIAVSIGKGMYQFSVADGSVLQQKSGKGLTGRAFEQEAFSDAFYQFLYADAGGSGTPWKDMTPEDRYAMAEEIGAKWDEHENSRTDQMRMGLAVRTKLGIDKWKPEYKSRAARRALRG